MYKSLTDFINKLESAGELVRIGTLVSSNEEIAEITDRFSKAEGGGKALLFEHTESGFPVLTNMMGSERRIALALGVESLDELPARIDAMLKGVLSPKGSLLEKMRVLPLLADAAKWFPKRVKGRGVCQQIILMGEEADINKLPVLKCWPADGGRFVTLPMSIHSTPKRGCVMSECTVCRFLTAKLRVCIGISTRPEPDTMKDIRIKADGCPLP